METGAETPIGARLGQVVERVPAGADFFLVNGDTYFDFDVLDMYRVHKRRNALLTLSSVEVQSQYGLIIEDQCGVVGFSRDQRASAARTSASIGPTTSTSS